MYTSLFQELTCGSRSEFWATILVHSSGMPNVCESAAETVDKTLDEVHVVHLAQWAHMQWKVYAVKVRL